MVSHLAFAALALFAPIQDTRPQTDPDPGEVRGRVRSETTGERLPYSMIEINGPSGSRLVMADSAGNYLVRDVPAGRYTLRASRFDHAPFEVEILVSEGRTVNLEVLLVQRPVELPGLTAKVWRRANLADTTNPPLPELSVAMSRALEATPGLAELGFGPVTAGVPGHEPVDPSDVIYVRGAPADMKLVLLDGAPVYAPFHLGGLIQAFDPGLLRSSDLYLGGAPARYDGGLSYVLGLETRAGRRSGGIRTTGAADVLSTRTTVEGPIASWAGFLVAGRSVHAWGARTLLGRDFPYGFADLLGRIDADVGEDGGIALTGFWNRESVRFDAEPAEPATDDLAWWGNRAASFRYRGGLGDFDTEITAAYGGYSARLPVGGDGSVLAEGRADRIRVAADVSRAWENTRIHYGVSYEHQSLEYQARPRSVPDGGAVILESTAAGEGGGAYIDIDWRPVEAWRIRGGGRVDIFSTDGVARFAPRLSATWTMSERAKLTLAAGRYRQFIRSTEPILATADESGAGLYYVPPPLTLARSSHLVLALDQDLGNGVSLGIEGFFKQFEDVPRADTIPGPVDGSFVQTTRSSRARASGVDLWLRRAEGRVTGWLSYSLNWVWSADGAAAAPTDHFAGRQILSFGLAGALTSNSRFDLRLSYGSGLPYSALPRVSSERETVPVFRMATTDAAQELSTVALNAPPLTTVPDEPYLRVDVEVSHEFTTRWGSRDVTISPYIKVLNALDRRDALFYQVSGDSDEPDPLAALPLLPVIGFRWTF